MAIALPVGALSAAIAFGVWRYQKYLALLATLPAHPPGPFVRYTRADGLLDFASEEEEKEARKKPAGPPPS